ncbi:MAG TPA: 6-phosphogluconolactonase [Candidatus Tyrphobacter sp.]
MSELTQRLADAFVSCARDAIAARDAFTVALAGGNTPRDAYALLAREPRRSSVAWKAVHVYFGDERCVPPEDPQSNYGMAKAALLDEVPIPRAQIHRMRGEIAPEQAALEYARVLRDTLGEAPHLDFVMLGLGTDAHTASLFPGEDPLTDDDALVRAVHPASMNAWRLTVTPRVINGAREVVFGVSGKEKAAALKAAREGPHDPVRFPAQIVKPTNGRLLWFVDAAALELRPPTADGSAAD